VVAVLFSTFKNLILSCTFKDHHSELQHPILIGVSTVPTTQICIADTLVDNRKLRNAMMGRSAMA
jgi:hypothetical protein